PGKVVRSMNNILETIVEHKRKEIATSRAEVSEGVLESKLAAAPPTRGFRAALETSEDVAIIAEVKKESPSAGIIREGFDPVYIGTVYANHGASCLSVLTDAHFFQGNLSHLTSISTAVKQPVLRKDFILDRYQLLEARVAGADAVLLIAEVLHGPELGYLFK